MFTKKLILAAAPILLAASTVHAAAGQTAEQCVFEKYAPASVAPYRVEENYGLGTYSHLRGAQLYVPAREGLTAEWLEASVQQALAQGPSEQACQPTDVQKVQVSVVSAGRGFWVQLAAADDRSAEKLLRWAQSIAPKQTRGNSGAK
ncbi:MAG TPA: hypothetical protein VJV78_13335 [Polyangiales bacterium]|nr:hypothetical protein [Polyangiales bacterium]